MRRRQLRCLQKTLGLILEENRQDLRQVVINLEALTRNLNQIALENRENLRGAIYSIRVLADNLNRTLPKTIEKH
jgi:phospholipid/cholesterol/gamma-HCH transport system substrate-binding protein